MATIFQDFQENKIKQNEQMRLLFNRNEKKNKCHEINRNLVYYSEYKLYIGMGDHTENLSKNVETTNIASI